MCYFQYHHQLSILVKAMPGLVKGLQGVGWVIRESRPPRTPPPIFTFIFIITIIIKNMLLWSSSVSPSFQLKGLWGRQRLDEDQEHQCSHLSSISSATSFSWIIAGPHPKERERERGRFHSGRTCISEATVLFGNQRTNKRRRQFLELVFYIIMIVASSELQGASCFGEGLLFWCPARLVNRPSRPCFPASLSSASLMPFVCFPARVSLSPGSHLCSLRIAIIIIGDDHPV